MARCRFSICRTLHLLVVVSATTITLASYCFWIFVPTDSKDDLLCWTAHENRTIIAFMLLEAGADLEARSAHDAIRFAVYRDRRWLVELFLERGADPNLVLLAACEAGRRQICSMALKRTANANVRDRLGRSALMKAAHGGSLGVTGTLLRWGADVDARGPLERAVLMRIAGRGGRPHIVGLLIASGADVTARDRFGETALMKAAKHGQLASVEAMLFVIPTLNARDCEGRTALMKAAAAGQRAAVMALLIGGSHVDARDDLGRTALIHAAQGGHAGVSRVLLRRFARVNARNDSGRNPLMTAAAQGNVGLSLFLLQHGADPSMRDCDNKTAVNLAREAGHTYAAEALREKAHAHAPNNEYQDKWLRSRDGYSSRWLEPSSLECPPSDKGARLAARNADRAIARRSKSQIQETQSGTTVPLAARHLAP